MPQPPRWEQYVPGEYPAVPLPPAEYDRRPLVLPPERRRKRRTTWGAAAREEHGR